MNEDKILLKILATLFHGNMSFLHARYTLLHKRSDHVPDTRPVLFALVARINFISDFVRNT